MKPTSNKTLRGAAAIAAAWALVTTAAAAAVDIQLVGRINLPNSIFLVNVVGYVDQSTLREYAIVGDIHDKVYIVDVTDPSDMRITAQISGIPGFDVKTWDHYLYTCDGNTGGNDSRVVDITDPANPIVLPNGFPSAHTFEISSAGIMFAEFPGLRIYDLNATPTIPLLLHESGGEGHDSMPKGTDRLYDFHGRDATVIWDVSDPAHPDTLGIVDDASIVFNHSGDTTADQRYLYICDELSTGSSPDITIWDIANPSTPVRVGQIADANSTVHNIYVVGDLAYTAYYASGFKVFDLTDPTRPALAGQYDTTKRSGEGFIGAIGAYVGLPSGNIFVCDIENGLFAFTVTPGTRDGRAGRRRRFDLEQNFPNPFNPSTRIPFELTRGGRVALSIYDVAGRRVRARPRPRPSRRAPRSRVGRQGRRGPAASPRASTSTACRPVTEIETRRMVLVK